MAYDFGPSITEGAVHRYERSGCDVLRHQFLQRRPVWARYPPALGNRCHATRVPTGVDMSTSITIASVSYRHRHPRKPLPLTSSPLVLLVEHEFASRVDSANELLDEGYDIVESETASEAVSILRGRNDFDTNHAPGGLALVGYTANHHPSMRILVRSAWPNAQAESGAINADFLSMPYPDGELVRRMQELLDHA